MALRSCFSSSSSAFFFSFPASHPHPHSHSHLHPHPHPHPRHRCNGEPASPRSLLPDLRVVASSPSPSPPSSLSSRRRGPLLLLLLGSPLLFLPVVPPNLRAEEKMASNPSPQFSEILDSGGVKFLDIKQGDGLAPQLGDKVVIHYYARLAAKQGWRFDSTYDHKDQNGAPEPFVFTLGSDNVIAGLDKAVRTMREGGIRRAIIPPSQGYLNTSQEPIPPNFFDRQRLFTTIFNPTRLANGEGSTLGTLVFDIELLRIRPS